MCINAGLADDAGWSALITLSGWDHEADPVDIFIPSKSQRTVAMAIRQFTHTPELSPLLHQMSLTARISVLAIERQYWDTAISGSSVLEMPAHRNLTIIWNDTWMKSSLKTVTSWRPLRLPIFSTSDVPFKQTRIACPALASFLLRQLSV